MPEKKLHEISQAWRELFEKGMTAYHRQNLDYAITIFNQILEKEPAFYDCREALRAAQFKKASASAGFFKKAFGKASTGAKLTQVQLLQRSNPLEAIHAAEQILNSDPHSAMAHRLLADAALAADLLKTAVLSLEIVLKNVPKDRGVALKLASALSRLGQHAKAEQILADFISADPSDSEVAQAYKDLSARRTMQEGGYDALSEGGGSYRDILKDKQASVAIEQEHREVKTDDVASNLIREYESRLGLEPNNLRLLRSLADLYVQKMDFEKALSSYQRILTSGLGNDPSLEKTIADTTLRKYDHALAQLDPTTPDYPQRSEQIKAERLAYQLAECQKRAERYPTDLQIRFEMGQIYFQAGKISEAIQEFQKAQANPNRRVQALYYLGQCFSRRGMFDLASRTLQNAIKEKTPFDEEKKELIYSLGCIYEKMKKPEEAIEQFKLIYEVDIGYKDIAAKVDAYYTGEGSV